jgi:hypothetical protein
MTTRYSKQLLSRLRNDISVEQVLCQLLNVKVIEQGGVKRFRCPLCSSMHTGINPQTNLSRCFNCRRNFNSIELVFSYRRCGFREAVEMLLPLNPRS